MPAGLQDPFHYAERAARVIRAARARITPHRSPPPAKAIAVIAQTIRRVASRRHQRQIAAAVGVAMAILGAVELLSLIPGRSRRTVAVAPAPLPASAPRPRLVAGLNLPATLASAGGPWQPLPFGHEWVADERLRTDAVPVTLTAADGTTLEIEPRSDLELLRADVEEWVRLGRGAVTLHVAKLQPGQRFVVLTPDAEVEVRGTRFQVALVAPSESCGRGTPTRVAVDEGVVVVRSTAAEVRVPAGRRWPAACPPPKAVVPPPSPVVTKRMPSSTPTPDSTLATENELFGAALRAGHFGDRVGAAHLLDALLTRFPKSPLRESAQRALAATTTASP